MGDYMIRGTAADGQIRFFAAFTKDTTEYARGVHDLSPIATAALGRLLTGSAMMGAMMKGDDDLLTVKIDCNGPIGGLSVTANAKGDVKGYVKNTKVDLPSKIPGKLNVGDALDMGVLSVIRDTHLKEPYVGQTILQSGEIAEDLTYYFTTSEQTPSSVALGVLMNKDNTVNTAGGFIVQVMPGADDETINELVKRIESLKSVTELLGSGVTIDEMMKGLFAGMDPEIMDTMPVRFFCGCSRERTADILMSLPEDELQSMIDDGETVEVNCHFCGKHYPFTVAEVQEILDRKPR